MLGVNNAATILVVAGLPGQPLYHPRKNNGVSPAIVSAIKNSSA